MKNKSKSIISEICNLSQSEGMTLEDEQINADCFNEEPISDKNRQKYLNYNKTPMKHM
jgi:hypothetical protein